MNGITPSTFRFNGNISAMKWKTGDESTERGYQLSYDGLNRLTAATYGEGASLTTNLNGFNEMVTEYDKMGNIKTLQRQGKLDSGYGLMDDLTYTYTGNQLTKVSDAATPAITYANAFHFVDRANVANEYTYDVNGNLTKDLNKNITSISYNALNLPSVITFTDGNTITYGYDAAGSKLSVAYTAGGSTVKTEYAGNKVYKNGTLSMILTQEGYLTLAGTTPTYYYYLKDHQGNNRVVINQSGAVQQVNHYYPFGGLFGEGIQTSNQPYKYNGKELDRFQGMDMYDYGARHYDAALGRWGTIDPMAEKYYSISPFVYVANNPVRFIDPNGMFYHDYSIDQEGYIKKEKDTEDKFDRLYTKKDYDKGKEGNVFKLGKEKAKDKTILADLEESRKDFKGSYATSTDKDESFQVFLFSADNTDVEWSISGFGKGKVDRYTVTTSHDDSKVVLGFGINGNNESNMIFTIHSHPSPTGTRGGSLSGGRGDMYNIIRRYDHFIEKGINPIYAPKEYVYHKYGKALYNYTPWNPSIYIRSINSAGDLHRGLGF